jgi:hypothetical protein
MVYLNFIEKINLRFFILNIFFLYYETKFLPGTLHGLLVLSGIGLLMIRWVSINSTENTISFDVFLAGLFIFIILISFFTQIISMLFESESFLATQFLNLRAYLFMPLTFLYMKFAFKSEDYWFLLKVCKWFLITNSLLMLAQLTTGSFYIAKLIAAGEGAYYIPSGWFDGPTKNGMIIAFAFSIHFGRFLFLDHKFTLTDWIGLALGFATLPIAASRAGLISVIAIVMAAFFLNIIFKSRRSNKQRNFGGAIRTSIFLLAAFVSVFLFVGDPKSFVDTIENVGEEASTISAIVYKATNILDDSISERFEFWSTFIDGIKQYPTVILSVGWGPGYFEISNQGNNMHNSYLELLFQLGLMGAIFFVSLLVYVCNLSQPLSNKYMLPIFLAMLSVMIFMMAHDVLRGRLFWMSLGILAASSSLFFQKTHHYHIKAK